MQESKPISIDAKTRPRTKHVDHEKIRKKKDFPRKRPHGMVLEGSEFSDLESSSGSNSLSSTSLKFPVSGGIRKSHSSVEGLKFASTQEQALATIDDFLADVDQEIAKAGDDIILKHTKPQITITSGDSEKPLLIRRSSSFPNISGDSAPTSPVRKQIQKSSMELDRIDVEKLPAQGKSKKDQSVTTLHTNEPLDTVHKDVNPLDKLIENLESLQQKARPSPEENKEGKEDNVDGGNADIMPKTRQEKLSKVHIKEKPKKQKEKPLKSKNETSKLRYPAIISKGLMLTAKSVENIKTALHNEKVASHKPENIVIVTNSMQSYACDDIDIGKANTNNEWRQASVKSPTLKLSPEKLNTSSLSRADATIDLTAESDKHILENQDDNAKVLSIKSASSHAFNPGKQDLVTTEFKYDDAVLTNHATLNTTEWINLQKAFPQASMNTSEDLWAQFSSYRSAKNNKKSTPSKRRRSWFLPKTDKKKSSNMYLPNTDLGGFNVNLLAAQALSDQLTLSLDMTTLENTFSSHSDNGSSILSPSDFTFNESMQVI